MFIIFAAALQLSTTITQDSKLPILNSFTVNSWFVDSNKQAFVDWEGNKVRQFYTSNDYSYPINVTVIVTSEFYPFIQESLAANLPKVDEITYTLYPKQHYKIAIEYNCSKYESSQIDLIIVEQSFKNNPNRLDEMKQIQLRYFKYCKNPDTPFIDYHNLFIIFSIFITTLLSALLCVKKSYTQFDFAPAKQVIALIILPAIGAFIYYPYIITYIFALIVLYDFTYCLSQSHILSILISLLGTQIQFYWENEIIKYLIAFILLVQVNKRIVIRNRIQLFVFFILIWLTEIYWLVHITQVDKHLLTQNSDQDSLFFKTSISLSKQDSEWQLKHIEIHLHQLLALTLIQSFIFRHGLFNKDHVVNITIVSIFQFTGLIVFDILYRLKCNPPFLTLITGFILIALAINHFRTGKGLRNPYIEFEEIDGKIKL